MKISAFFTCIIPIVFMSCESLPTKEDLDRKGKELLKENKDILIKLAEQETERLYKYKGWFTLDECLAEYGPPSDMFRGDAFIQVVYREARPSPLHPYEYYGDTNEYETRTFYFTKWREGDGILQAGQHILRDVQYEYIHPALVIHYRSKLDFREKIDGANTPEPTGQDGTK